MKSTLIPRSFLNSFLAFTILMSTEYLCALELQPNEIRGDKVINPVSILQNRYFLKSFRPEIGMSVGTFLNEAYTDTSLWGYRGSLFVNEWLGFEAQYVQTNVADSEDRRALNQLKYQKIGTTEVVSPDPEINRIHGSQDIGVIVAPFYGKLNLLDSIIIYSDLYLTAGLAKVDTDQGRLNSVTWSAGQRFYWKKSLSFRVEVRDRIYNEDRTGENYTRNAYSVDFGLSYFLF